MFIIKIILVMAAIGVVLGLVDLFIVDFMEGDLFDFDDPDPDPGYYRDIGDFGDYEGDGDNCGPSWSTPGC